MSRLFKSRSLAVGAQPTSEYFWEKPAIRDKKGYWGKRAFRRHADSIAHKNACQTDETKRNRCGKSPMDQKTSQLLE